MYLTDDELLQKQHIANFQIARYLLKTYGNKKLLVTLRDMLSKELIDILSRTDMTDAKKIVNLKIVLDDNALAVASFMNFLSSISEISINYGEDAVIGRSGIKEHEAHMIVKDVYANSILSIKENVIDWYIVGIGYCHYLFYEHMLYQEQVIKALQKVNDYSFWSNLISMIELNLFYQITEFYISDGNLDALNVIRLVERDEPNVINMKLSEFHKNPRLMADNLMSETSYFSITKDFFHFIKGRKVQRIYIG